jgi:hypothetical protein
MLEAMDRRAFLKLIAAAAAAAPAWTRGQDLPETSQLVVGQLEHAGRWNPRPSGLRRLCWEIAQRTSIETGTDAVPVRIGPGLHRHPMLYLSGEGAMPPFRDEERGLLRRHLQYGGFLLVDAADGSDGSGFDASVRRELALLLPTSPLVRLPRDHVILKSFYLLDQIGGRTLAKPWLEAQVIDGRVAVLYSQNDLAGAWARGPLGDWEYECTPGGETQREATFRLGVNIAMYALCTDYKDDAVHLPFILKRRS